MLANQEKATDRRDPASAALRDEAALFHRVSQGDLRAFEALYRIYHPRLNRFVLNMTRRASIAEEVLNDTMLVVWDRPDSYSGASRLSTWIFAIAYRKALKALRRQDLPIEDAAALTRASGESGPEQQLGRLEAQQQLAHAINELSADHRAVVDLSYFHDMGYREIAAIMACPVDTVKTRMFHARRHLKKRLDGQLADWW